jgi:thiol-disulfide isomerase/thioredoxin
MKKIKTTTLIILSLILSSSVALANSNESSALSRDSKSYVKSGFYSNDNKYRGFYWFEEEKKKRSRSSDQSSPVAEYQIPSAVEAKEMIRKRKEDLDNARAQFVATGFDPNAPMHKKREAIIAYKKLEQKMWGGLSQMWDAAEMSNLTNPEIADVRNNPTNVYGVKLKRKLAEKENNLKIMEFATEYDLVLFGDAGCPYCIEFMPIVKGFVEEYSFKLDVSTLSGESGRMAAKLGIQSTPTLVAVKKDGSKIFEVSRGLVSGSGLERSILLAKRYDAELSQSKKRKPGIRNANASIANMKLRYSNKKNRRNR